MKKIIALVLALLAFANISGSVKAAKPDVTGFDMYGYNYAANLFNGWYGQWSQKPLGLGWDGTTLDAYLVMKWSQDWIPQGDEPVGAWVTNHWTWYSNDYDEATWYGFTSRVPWLDKDADPEADYKIEEFSKIQRVGNNYEEWQRYSLGGAYDAAWGTYLSGVPKYVVYQDVITVYGKTWNIDGAWGVDFNSTIYPSGNPYAHSLTVTGGTATGSSTGNTYTATVSVTGNSVVINATYLPGSGAYPYSYTATGTISGTGALSGTWTGSDGDSGTWSSTSGAATFIWQSIAEYNIATTSPKGLGKPIF